MFLWKNLEYLCGRGASTLGLGGGLAVGILKNRDIFQSSKSLYHVLWWDRNGKRKELCFIQNVFITPAAAVPWTPALSCMILFFLFV